MANSMSNNELHMLEKKNKIRQGFLEIFQEQEIEFKKRIHLCQYHAYKDSKDLKEAESKARLCFDPYLIMQRHMIAKIEPIEDKYEKCINEKKLMQKVNLSSLDFLFGNCLIEYGGNIKRIQPQFQDLYRGYLQNLKESYNPDNEKI